MILAIQTFLLEMFLSFYVLTLQSDFSNSLMLRIKVTITLNRNEKVEQHTRKNGKLMVFLCD